MDFTSAEIKWEDAMTLLFLSFMVLLFVFTPMFLIVLRELSKFKNNDIKEHESGQSQISYFLVLSLLLVFVWIAYDAFVWTLEHIFENWGAISGHGGLTQSFWTVQHIEVDSLTNAEVTAGAKIIDSIIILRHFAETLCFVVIFTMLYFSVKTTNLMITSFKDDSERNGMVGTALKIFLVGFVGYMSISMYDVATVDILNHPKDYGVWDISTQWIKTGIKEFGLTLNDGEIN